MEMVREPYDAKRRIRAVRHAPAGKHADNRLRALTPEGITLANKKGMSISNMDSLTMVGSPRQRTGHTLAEMVHGVHPEITIAKEDVPQDSRLDFYDDVEHVPLEKKVVDIYLGTDPEPKGYVRYMVEDSDTYAREHGGNDRMSYTKTAARVASVFLDMVQKPITEEELKTFNRNHEPIVDSLVCSHGGIFEVFLAKVIEKLEGKERRDAFVDSFQNKNSEMGNIQGFDIDIEYAHGVPRIFINFQSDTKKTVAGDTGKTYEEPVFDFNAELPLETLQEIIDEGGGYVEPNAIV